MALAEATLVAVVLPDFTHSPIPVSMAMNCSPSPTPTINGLPWRAA